MRELALIDVERMAGLEIGPLASPRIDKARGRVRYVDHASAAELRAKYATNSQMAPHLDAIVEVDYVLKDGTGLGATVGEDGPFDYVLASHVIEHIPDPVGWLRELAGVLVTGGIVSLVVPDKRFCFDLNRRLTDTADVVDAYLRGLKAPTYRQIYDFFANAVTIDGMVDTAAIWAGTADYRGAVRQDVTDPDVDAYAKCLSSRDDGTFFDVHCHTFTPASLLQIYHALVRLDLVEFEIGCFFPTEPDTLEFHLSLRKVDTTIDRRLLRQAQLASIPELGHAGAPAARSPSPYHGPGPTGEPSPKPPSDGPRELVVSSAEQRVILMKRRALESLRAARASLGSR